MIIYVKNIYRRQCNVIGVENPGQCPRNCGELFEKSHILVCKNINASPTETYEMLINGNLNDKKKAITAWMKNMKIFEEKSALDSIF